MDDAVRAFIFDTAKDCFEFMNGPLTNYALFSQELSRMIKVKEGENEQFSFDVELDERIKASLASHGITGAIFSEESGFFELPGDKTYRVVYDPFCNSSLASRTFREGALGLSVFTYDYAFVASFILDYQTGILAVADHQKTRFYQAQTGQLIALGPSTVAKLEDAWVVLTLENPDERAHLTEAGNITRAAKRIMSSSGHIYWLKLAAGFIDGYTDPFGGEALYEMLACTVAQKAGCTVTGKNGVEFDPAKHLKLFEQDKHYLFYPVAASNKALHAALLSAL